MVGSIAEALISDPWRAHEDARSFIARRTSRRIIQGRLCEFISYTTGYESQTARDIAPRKITDGREDVDTLDDCFLEHSLWKNGT
ncbi:hypothetical protein V1477_015328, partial [Vespula maculifrons]